MNGIDIIISIFSLTIIYFTVRYVYKNTGREETSMLIRGNTVSKGSKVTITNSDGVIDINGEIYHGRCVCTNNGSLYIDGKWVKYID